MIKVKKRAKIPDHYTVEPTQLLQPHLSTIYNSGHNLCNWAYITLLGLDLLLSLNNAYLIGEGGGQIRYAIIKTHNYNDNSFIFG